MDLFGFTAIDADDNGGETQYVRPSDGCDGLQAKCLAAGMLALFFDAVRVDVTVAGVLVNAYDRNDLMVTLAGESRVSVHTDLS